MTRDDAFRLEADIDDGAVTIPAHDGALYYFAPFWCSVGGPFLKQGGHVHDPLPAGLATVLFYLEITCQTVWSSLLPRVPRLTCGDGESPAS